MKILLAVAAATVLLTSSAAVSQPAKPTIVLVHGAFADSSSWNRVIGILEKDGYPVVAVANPLRDLRSDAQYLTDIVTGIKSPLGAALAAPVALSGGGKDLYIDQSKFHAQFAADVSAKEAAAMAAGQRPVTEAALNEAAGEPAWKSIPSWFVFGDADRNIPAQALAFMAERAKSRQTEAVRGGSHAVMVSNAGAVAKMIERAATSLEAS